VTRPANDARPLEALLAAVAEGDRAAFATLYARTSAKLYGTILRILPEGGTAEDALQDVYARIWKVAASYDATRGRPITWLAAIARNRALDILRSTRGGAGRARIVDVDADTLAAIADEHQDAAESAALARCLDQLDPVHRECILLAYLDGATREELAARFGRPTGTIKSWLSRGLLSLRGCLRGD
jgi:RNA polymerase sigma-70 factor (ECF subfamily)